jgi:hypothetical protein
LDRSASLIDRDVIGWSSGSANGLACAGCHTSGPLSIRDEVRAAAEADKAMAKDLRDAVQTLYPPEADFSGLITEDHQHHRKAMQNAGLNPDLTVHGLEPMTALARQYQKSAGMNTISAETGLPPDDLLRRLSDAPDSMKPALRRFKQGAISREDLNRLTAFALGEPNSGAAPAVATDAAAPTAPRGLTLQMWPTQDRYKVGELAAFFVESNMDCNLTLVSVDAAGRATVLFPNEFEQSNVLSAAKPLRIPSEAAPFQLRLKTPGRESVIGICNIVAKTADGIAHDYERQRFTILGDWRTFLGQLSLEDGGDQKVDRTTDTRPRSRPPQRSRTRGAVAPAAPVTVEVAPAPAVEMQARTAVTVEVD